LPVGLAFKQKKSGQAYGIEPWSNMVAVETATNAPNDEWWSKVDFNFVKKHFLQKLIDYDLVDFIRVIELPSDAAFNALLSPRFYGQVDLVHIDGSHSTEQSVFDVAFWSRVARPGAIIVLDDINWPSVALAYQYMKEVCDLVEAVDEVEKGHFAIFRKRGATA
jgi:predicted O-methyltransferase YrrM